MVPNQKARMVIKANPPWPYNKWVCGIDRNTSETIPIAGNRIIYTSG
jgi:hypothetical protein